MIRAGVRVWPRRFFCYKRAPGNGNKEGVRVWPRRFFCYKPRICMIRPRCVRVWPRRFFCYKDGVKITSEVRSGFGRVASSAINCVVPL